MNNKIVAAAAFAIGAALGSAATYILTKKRNEDFINSEVATMREYYIKKYDEVTGTCVEEESDQDISQEDDPEEYSDKDLMKKGVDILVDYHGYYPSEDSDEAPKVETGFVKGDPGDRPYIIPPEEFANLEGYSTNSLFFFADHVVTDDDFQPLDDVDEIIGNDALNHFGEYEDDAVYVRNDKTKSDYEVLLDERKYSDVRPDGVKPEGD